MNMLVAQTQCVIFRGKSINLIRQVFTLLVETSLFIPLIFSLILSYSSPSLGGLTAKTSKTIQGTAPHFSPALEEALLNGGNFELFGFKFGSQTYYSADEVDAVLTSKGLTFGEQIPNYISSALGGGNMAYTIKTPIVNTDVYDDDGDSFAILPLEVLPMWGLSTNWFYDNNGVETFLGQVTGNMTKTFCELSSMGIIPYIKIEGPFTLVSEYGNPNKQIYNAASTESPIAGLKNPVRRFYPSNMTSICYAKPSITTSSTTSVWSKDNGFLPQPSPEQNFPKSGADGLYFDLILVGGKEVLQWDTVSVNGITATMSNISANSVRVTLNGPKASSYYIGATAPSFTGPVAMTIVGKNAENTPILTYGFELTSWFVNRGSHQDSMNPEDVAGDMNSWCTNLGDYRLPTVNELTNATRLDSPAWIGSSPTNRIVRRVDEGLFTEWGMMYQYTGSNFSSNGYWTSSITPSPPIYYYHVGAMLGDIGATSMRTRYGVCRAL